jgi:hypothetical protein
LWLRAEGAWQKRSPNLILQKMGFSISRKSFLKPAIIALAAAFSCFLATGSHAETISVTSSDLGIIKGVVRDNSGSPIADATVAIFRAGTTRLLKQVQSASDGSFLAKIIPGTYTVLAVAQGFNPVTLSDVEVARSSELVYGFKLERAGSGNTLPEKRPDRNSSKWRIRAAQAQRSIYQNREGDVPIDETADPSAAADETADIAEFEEGSDDSPIKGVVETYFAGSRNGNYTGVNFAAFMPVTAKADIIIAGQTGTGKAAPKRLETNLKFRANDTHQVRLNAAIGKLGTFSVGNDDRPLGQLSIQALDEWKVREGVIVVFGADYSRFLGASNDQSFSPRLGLQFDIDPKTRFRAAYTTKTDDKNWARAIELEDTQVVFSEPVAVEDFVVTAQKPRMNKSSRLEFGIERVLDNNSSIEANAFLDTTLARGVGLTAFPLDTLDPGVFGEFVSNQQGKARGVRMVYTRRIGGRYTTSAGYSFGSGQRLSEDALTDPAHVFENAVFQSFFGQVDADFSTGTNIRTVLRLSPRATVFAIDPFLGRLAIYDPGLSVLVTQNLPTLGLPIHAEATVDARNLFDFQGGVTGETGGLHFNSQGRMLRGGILVRF